MGKSGESLHYGSCFGSFEGCMEINPEQFNPAADLAAEVLLTLVGFNRSVATRLCAPHVQTPL